MFMKTRRHEKRTRSPIGSAASGQNALSCWGLLRARRREHVLDEHADAHGLESFDLA